MPLRLCCIVVWSTGISPNRPSSRLRQMPWCHETTIMITRFWLYLHICIAIISSQSAPQFAFNSTFETHWPKGFGNRSHRLPLPQHLLCHVFEHHYVYLWHCRAISYCNWPCYNDIQMCQESVILIWNWKCQCIARSDTSGNVIRPGRVLYNSGDRVRHLNRITCDAQIKVKDADIQNVSLN